MPPSSPVSLHRPETEGSASPSMEEQGPASIVLSDSEEDKSDSDEDSDDDVDETTNQRLSDTLDFDDDTDKKDKVISMLEEWAQWEKNLEEAAEQGELAPSIHDAVDTPAAENAGAVEYSVDHNIGDENGNGADKGGAVSPPGKSSTDATATDLVNTRTDEGASAPPQQTTERKLSGCSTSDPEAMDGRHAQISWTADAVEEDTASSRGKSTKIRSAKNPLPVAPRRTPQRELSLGSRTDPAAKARRHALRTWATDHGKNVPTAPSDVKCVTAGPRSVDDPKHPPEGETFGNTWPRRRSYPPEKIACCWRRASTCIELKQARHFSAAPSASPGGKRRVPHDRHPWRTNMKAPIKPVLSPSLRSAEDGEDKTAPSTPRSPDVTLEQMRPSPWARSPSRETAGGLLVKESFFYGSGGKAIQAGAPADGPNFEAGWMRQFREEVTNNANWWAWEDHHKPHRSFEMCESYRFSVVGKARQDVDVNMLPAREKNEGKRRPQDLWNAVSSRLAHRRHVINHDARVEDGPVRGPTDSSEGRVDVPSLHDRLRYTPLSQGAWVVDAAAAVAGGTGRTKSASQKYAHSSGCQSPESLVGFGVTPSRRRKHTLPHQTVSAGVRSRDENIDIVHATPTTHTGDNAAEHDEGVAVSEEGNNLQVNGTHRNRLQSVYDQILVKLRGEIDSFTREGIILQAAEDARGALARAREHSASPRRSHGSASSRTPSPAANPPAIPPEAIDYDHIEATLSLIELASRAAGPDAGRQMLQALEDLEKKVHGQTEVEGTRPAAEEYSSAEVVVTGARELAISGASAVESQPAVVGTDSLLASSMSLCSGEATADSDSAAGVLQTISGWFRKGRSSEARRQSIAGDGTEDDVQQVPNEEEVKQRLDSLHRRASETPQTNDHDSQGNVLKSEHGLCRKGRERRTRAEEGKKDELGACATGINARNNVAVDTETSTHPGMPPLGRRSDSRSTPSRNKQAANKRSSANQSGSTSSGDGLQEFHMALDGSASGKIREILSERASRLSSGKDTAAVAAQQKSRNEVAAGGSATVLDRSHRADVARPVFKGIGSSRGDERPLSRGQRDPADDSVQHGRKSPLGTGATTGSLSCAGDARGKGAIRMRCLDDGRDSASSERQLTNEAKSEICSRVCGKQAWPSSHQPCGAKHLSPESNNKATTASGFINRPGIIRRSPLIDALHPALAGQRAPELRLQHAHLSRQTAPVPAVSISGEANANPGAGCAHSTARFHHRNTRGAANTQEPQAAGTLFVATPPCPPVPMSHPPRPSSSFTKIDSRHRVDAGETHGEPAICDNRSSAEDAAVNAGGLTHPQWSRVEAWMARAKRLLGPDVWDCLGSGVVFTGLRDRVRMSVLPTKGRETFSSGAWHGGDTNASHNRTASEDWGRLKHDQKAREQRSVGQGSNHGVMLGEGKNRCDGIAGGWDDHISRTAALAVEATLWMLAPERERSATCTAFKRRFSNDSDAGIVSQQSTPTTLNDTRRLYRENEEPGGRRSERSFHGGFEPRDTEIGVSLARARRFVKSCHLVNGVKVVEADVDLAFRQWENLERGRGTASATSTTTTTTPVEAKQPIRAAPLCEVDPKVKSDVRPYVKVGAERRCSAVCPRLCEAVGCSEVARYGDLRPGAPARLCRRHRADGMADIAGLRCERAECQRLAVGGGRGDKSIASGVSGMLCALHLREGRVGLEEMSSALFALARAHQNRLRSRPVYSGTKQSRDGCPSIQASSVEEPDDERLARAVMDSFAVRNVLLALTDQPLAPGAPIPEHAAASSTNNDSKRRVVPLPGEGFSLHCGIQTMEHLHPATISVSQKELEREPHTSIPGQIAITDKGRRASSSASASEGILAREIHSAPNNFLDQSETSTSNREADCPGGSNGNESGYIGDDGGIGSRAESGLTSEGIQKADGMEGGVIYTEVEIGNVKRGRSFPKGVGTVLAQNAKTLKAVFRAYSRSSLGIREMWLSDLLRFCDAFELRPGLVTTREILDAYKEVVFPGVIGLTDREIGYSPIPFSAINTSTAQGAHTHSTSSKSFNREQGDHIETKNRLSAPVSVAEAVPSVTPATPTSECSHFKLESEINGNRTRSHSVDPEMRTPRRDVSPSTKLRGGGRSPARGGGRGGSRRIYLSRSQPFPLRRVESTLAVNDRGFGLSGVATGVFSGNGTWRPGSTTEHNSRARRSSSVGSFMSRRTSSSHATSTSIREVQEPLVGPGLSQAQFFEWLAEVIIECSALTKTFKKSSGTFMGSTNVRGHEAVERDSRGGSSVAEIGRGKGRARGDGGVATMNAAKTVALLRWMDLSHGTIGKRVPAFHLSSQGYEGTYP